MTRLDYGQFLLSSQINYTLTYFAEHALNQSEQQRWSHDTITRYLRGDRVTPSLLWDNVKSDVVSHERGYLLFDSLPRPAGTRCSTSATAARSNRPSASGAETRRRS